MLVRFLRGLFEAEGSLCIHLPTCTYNFGFCNKNPSLLTIVKDSLELLGYNPKISGYNIGLRRKAEVESFRILSEFRKY
jgi:hypothetical protein